MGHEEARVAPRRAKTTTQILLATLLALAASVAGIQPAHAGTGSISGYAFQDLNRDAVREADEPAYEGHQINLYDGAGTYVRNTTTDAAGHYAFAALAPGAYAVSYHASSWYALRDTMVPTTTTTFKPERSVGVTDGAVVADFGWRAIVRSTSASAPISSFTGPSGIKIKSYNDVVPAQEIYGRLQGGSLFGAEAATTTIRHDLGTAGTTTTTSVGSSNGTYTSFLATLNISWLSWLTGAERSLFHEYGHVWSLYNAYIVQQDPDLTSYLDARGLTGDARLETSHGWSRREMIAEDYRQLFGSPDAMQAPQENRDIAAAASVAGLREFLSSTFMSPPASPAPGPSPSPSSTPSPPATMHVHDLDATSTKLNSKSWVARITVAIDDAGELPLVGSTVWLAWDGGRKGTVSTSCITAADGTCTVPVELGNKLARMTFTVAKVESTSVLYDGARNHDADGDSTGTVITASKP